MELRHLLKAVQPAQSKSRSTLAMTPAMSLTILKADHGGGRVESCQPAGDS
jgi:hypothetical protein